MAGIHRRQILTSVVDLRVERDNVHLCTQVCITKINESRFIGEPLVHTCYREVIEKKFIISSAISEVVTGGLGNYSCKIA